MLQLSVGKVLVEAKEILGGEAIEVMVMVVVNRNAHGVGEKMSSWESIHVLHKLC